VFDIIQSDAADDWDIFREQKRKYFLDLDTLGDYRRECEGTGAIKNRGIQSFLVQLLN
jgi:hypothetical protein